MIGIAIDILLAMVVTATPAFWLDLPIRKNMKINITPNPKANGNQPDVAISLKLIVFG